MNISDVIAFVPASEIDSTIPRIEFGGFVLAFSKPPDLAWAISIMAGIEEGPSHKPGIVRINTLLPSREGGIEDIEPLPWNLRALALLYLGYAGIPDGTVRSEWRLHLAALFDAARRWRIAGSGGERAAANHLFETAKLRFFDYCAGLELMRLEILPPAQNEMRLYAGHVFAVLLRAINAAEPEHFTGSE